MTAADKVACFSNSASFLTLYAPGAPITAAGYTMGGTSQATPHVAGALALLAQRYPEASPLQLKNRLIAAGVNVQDPRNGIVTPRLDLGDFVIPMNDAFISPAIIGGASGNIALTNQHATKERGEPNHADNSGGAWLWLSWMAITDGYVALSTAGSNVDTVLAVYQGNDFSSLVLWADNDDDATGTGSSEVVFYAATGQTYFIAVDGKNNTQGSIQFMWRAVSMDENDVPFLPGWAIGLLMLGLSGVINAAARHTLAVNPVWLHRPQHQSTLPSGYACRNNR